MVQKIYMIVSSFNNNEIATLLLIIFALVLFKPLRTCLISIISILKEFLSKNKIFQMILVELSLYFFIVTIFLHHINLWNLINLKDSILWLLFSGFVLYKDIITDKIWQETMKNYLLKVISISAIYEFIVNIICLPIWVLLLLIPLICFLQMISSYAEDKKEYKSAYIFADNLITMIGFGILIYIGHRLIQNYEILLQKENLKAFLLPIIYTIAFLPFSLVNKTFTEYQQAYKRLSWRSDVKIPVNFKYVYRIFQFCKLDFVKLNKFLFFLTSSCYLKKTTDINNLIIEYKKRKTFLKYDSSCIGFEIEKVLNLLSSHNMKIDDYKDIEYDDKFGNYYGLSSYKMNIRSFDNITYAATGTNQVIQYIELSYLKSQLTPEDLSKENDNLYRTLSKILYSFCFNNDDLTIDLFKSKIKIDKIHYSIENDIDICNHQLTEYKFSIYVKNPEHSNYYISNGASV